MSTTPSPVAMCSVVAGTYANSNALSLSLDLHYGGDKGGTFSISGGNTLVFPVTMYGLYKVDFTAAVKHSSTANPSEVTIQLHAGSSSSYAVATRFSATASHYVQVAGSMLFRPVTTADMAVFLTNESGASVTFDPGLGKLIVTRVTG